MFNLAQAYRFGRGVPANLATAKNLFERAARGGHVESQTTLGLLLRNAALQMSDNLADELLHPEISEEVQGLAVLRKPAFDLSELSEVAVSATPGRWRARRPRAAGLDG